jgi:hypothetical protein
MGVVISKRQAVRLLTAKLETFRAEDAAVLKAGLSGAYVTVDGAGARHAGKSGYATLDRLLRLHDVWRRALQVAPGVSVAALSTGCAGFTPNGSFTSSSPSTTSSPTPLRAPSG